MIACLGTSLYQTDENKKQKQKKTPQQTNNKRSHLEEDFTAVPCYNNASLHPIPLHLSQNIWTPQQKTSLCN